jgi:hypothetical protein
LPVIVKTRAADFEGLPTRVADFEGLPEDIEI